RHGHSSAAGAHDSRRRRCRRAPTRSSLPLRHRLSLRCPYNERQWTDVLNKENDMQLFRRICASLTTICFLALGMTAPANAALIGTDAYLNSVERAERVAAGESALARDDVRAQLERMGVDAEEAVARVAHL